MKKKLILAIVFLGLLTGCSKEKSLKCTHKDENNNMSVTTTQKYVFNKDLKKINKVVVEYEYVLKDQYLDYLNNNSIDIDDAINTESICNSYKTLKNSTCKTETKNNIITIKIEVDETKNKKKSYNGDYTFFKEYYEGIGYECK